MRAGHGMASAHVADIAMIKCTKRTTKYFFAAGGYPQLPRVHSRAMRRWPRDYVRPCVTTESFEVYGLSIFQRWKVWLFISAPENPALHVHQGNFVMIVSEYLEQIP